MKIGAEIAAKHCVLFPFQKIFLVVLLGFSESFLDSLCITGS